MSSCGYIGKSADTRDFFRVWAEYIKCYPELPCFVKYPTSVLQLHERLSEMVYHDRILYIVAPNLQSSISPLLDITDSKNPTIVLNNDGVLHGVTVDITPQNVLDILKSRILVKNTV
jgi:hypothetical protein